MYEKVLHHGTVVEVNHDDPFSLFNTSNYCFVKLHEFHKTTPFTPYPELVPMLMSNLEPVTVILTTYCWSCTPLHLPNCRSHYVCDFLSVWHEKGNSKMDDDERQEPPMKILIWYFSSNSKILYIQCYRKSDSRRKILIDVWSEPSMKILTLRFLPKTTHCNSFVHFAKVHFTIWSWSFIFWWPMVTVSKKNGKNSSQDDKVSVDDGIAVIVKIFPPAWNIKWTTFLSCNT